MRRHASRETRSIDSSSWATRVAPGRPQPIRGQRRRAFEVRTSYFPRPERAHRIEIENQEQMAGLSDTARQIGQINEHSIWASIEFRTRGAIPFAPGADGIACHRARPSRLILSIQDSYHFRRDSRGAFKSVFRQFVLLCRRFGLYGRELLAVDGTRIKAVNNKDCNFTRASLREFIRAADERLNEYLERLDHGDVEDGARLLVSGGRADD